MFKYIHMNISVYVYVLHYVRILGPQQIDMVGPYYHVCPHMLTYVCMHTNVRSGAYTRLDLSIYHTLIHATA